MTQPIVEVKGLVKKYPDRHRFRIGRRTERVALDGVDMQVFSGEIFGLLGPNGAGKTTLLRTLTGLLLPDAGTVYVNGYDVTKQARQARASIGFVFGDERSFYWRLSVRENLRFQSRLFGLKGKEADRKISELIELVGLGEAGDLPMQSFSAGMRQRAGIARGLINDPTLIIMDEPTRSLDPLGAQELRGLIAERMAAGRTVLLATNLMHEAEALCNRLMLIDHGHALVTGTVEDFRRGITTDVVYELILSGHDSCSKEGLEALEGIREATVEKREHGAILVRLTMDGELNGLPRAIRYFMERALEVVSCNRRDPSLDQMFQEIVQRRRREVAAMP